MWKKLSILLALTTILLSACSSGQAEIAVERERIDLGQVVNGEIVTRQIRVRNEGNVDLVIDAVSTSCGCTQATVEPMNIPPGGSGLLTIEFDSGAHGEELTGSLIRQIFIASNDPERQEVVVELAVDVTADSS